MSRESILIVEDDLQLTVYLRRALENLLEDGCRVETSPLADGALAELKRKRFDLIVTDLRMPGMNGLEFIQRVRQLSPQTRTMLITAFGSPEVESRAHGLGATYLRKPFRLHEFVATVQHILDEERSGRKAEASHRQDDPGELAPKPGGVNKL